MVHCVYLTVDLRIIYLWRTEHWKCRELDKFAAPLDVAVKKAFQLQEGEAPLTRVSDPGEGAMGPHLTQCGRGRGVPPWHVSSWSIQQFGHNTPTSQTGQIGQLSDIIALIVFGRPFVKRFALFYRTVVLSVLSPTCPVLSVCNVGVLWPNCWADQDETWHVGRPRPYCVISPPSSSLKRHSPQFSAHVCVAKRLDGLRRHLVWT